MTRTPPPPGLRPRTPRWPSRLLLAPVLGLGCANAEPNPVPPPPPVAPAASASATTAESPPPQEARDVMAAAPGGGLVVGEATPVPIAMVPETPATRPEDEARVREAGWSWLAEKLVADGLPRDRVIPTLADPRFEPFDGLFFSIRPRESRALYRHVRKARTVRAARRCLAEHEEAFARAERDHGVPASLLAALLQVETACGRNTGSSLILHRLARLAMANEPANLEANIERNATRQGRIDPALAKKTRERGLYLENLFYPEVKATFVVADRLGVSPLDLYGSSAGAFGYPQFLPSSYLAHGVDGDGDGKVSLWDVDDAVSSAARYLVAHGWKEGLSRKEQRQVIWHYNRSDAYIDAVLGLADRVEAGRRS